MTLARLVIAFAIAVAIAAMLALVFYRVNEAETRACQANQVVRVPLTAYIDSELRLVAEAKRQGIPLGPPELARIQAESFHHLEDLNRALHAARVRGCAA